MRFSVVNPTTPVDFQRWPAEFRSFPKLSRHLLKMSEIHLKTSEWSQVSLQLRRQLTLNQWKQIKTDNLFSNGPIKTKLGTCKQCQQQHFFRYFWCHDNQLCFHSNLGKQTKGCHLQTRISRVIIHLTWKLLYIIEMQCCLQWITVFLFLLCLRHLRPGIHVSMATATVCD